MYDKLEPYLRLHVYYMTFNLFSDFWKFPDGFPVFKIESESKIKRNSVDRTTYNYCILAEVKGMGQLFAKTEHTFIQDCQRHLSQLDEMLLSLATSVDSVHTTAELVLCELEKVSERKKGCIEEQNDMLMAKKLLSSVEENLHHQKMSVLQEICQLKRLIRDKSKRDQMLSAIPALYSLKVDEYVRNVQEKEKELLLLSNEKKEPVNNNTKNLEEHTANVEHTIEALRKEIEKVTSEKAVQIEDNKKMNETLQRLIQEKAEQEIKNAMLENEGKRQGIIPVQLYYQHGGDQVASLVQDIMSLLSTQGQSENRKLAFIRCAQTDDIQAHIPLLVLCINTSRIGTDAKLAIQGIQYLKNTALLIFHHKDEHALPEQSSSRVLTNSEFKLLGGIFDMAFLSGRGIYQCEKNTQTTCNILSFINKLAES